MSDLVITIIITVVASSGFWAFLQSVMNHRAKRKSVDRKALLALLHDKLYYTLSDIIKSGSVSTDDYDNLTYLYEPYKEMGGNGTCERLMDEVKKMPISNK